MPDRLITHLRHVDLAVPDYARQREFYAGVWGLTEVAGDTGISFLAAEGSPEQYIVRLRKAGEKRLGLVSFGAASAADVDALAERLGAAGVRLVGEPGGLATPGGGYGFRFFDIDGRTVEVSSDVAVRPHRRLEEREAVPVRLSHVVLNSPRPRRDPRLVRAAPGLRAVGHAGVPAHGRGHALHALQPAAPQHGDRGGAAHVAAPHLLRDARPGRVHVRDGAAAARRRPHDLGAGAPQGGDNTFSYFLDPHGNTVEYTTELELLDEDAWHPHLYDFSDLDVTDQWGTANPMNELIAKESFNDPDRGVFVAPPV